MHESNTGKIALRGNIALRRRPSRTLIGLLMLMRLLAAAVLAAVRLVLLPIPPAATVFMIALLMIPMLMIAAPVFAVCVASLLLVRAMLMWTVLMRAALLRGLLFRGLLFHRLLRGLLAPVRYRRLSCRNDHPDQLFDVAQERPLIV